MANYDIVLFDLDGTLTDSKIGLVNSIRYALQKFDIDEQDEDKLNYFIGPSLYDSFPAVYAFDEPQTEAAVSHFREYFKERGMFENELYSGVREMLEELTTAGKSLHIATSKPEVFARTILGHFGVDHYFQVIKGSELDGTRSGKSDIIGEILAEVNPHDKEKVVMIGDRKYDIIGANKCGLKSIGALYGYGTEAELNEHQPTHLAKSIKELGDILLGK